MKKILLTLLFIMVLMAGYSQLVNTGGNITIQNGATLVIQGDYTCSGSGDVEIDGTMDLKGHFINNDGTINSGSDGTLIFSGSSAQQIKGTHSTIFDCDVEIDNAAGVSLTTMDQEITGTLALTDGLLSLGNYDLTLGSATSGASSSSYVVTEGTGQLIAPVTNSDFLFPVGTSTSYNPITLNEGTNPDDYGVIYSTSNPGAWAGGTQHFVSGHWTVTEGTAGGANLSATLQWNGTQEQTGFSRTDCAVGVSTDNGATFAWAASGAASGGNPYTRTGTGFNTVGKFMVGDYFFEGIDLDLDVFLAGPYSGGVMTTNLNTKGLIQLTDPYGLGTTVSSIPSNVVDWIKVELRDKNASGTILHSKAFFLDNTGNVISPDGASVAKIKGIAKDQFYVAVKHRNHLGVMTSSPVDLTADSPAFNFKTGTGIYQTQSYTPMYSLGSGNYGLYKGNVNGDASVRKVGTTGVNDYSALLNYLVSNPATNVYAGADINLDGDVKKTGPSGQNDYSHLLNTLPGIVTIILQQVP